MRIPVYVALFTLFVAETALQSDETYTTQAARAAYVATVEGNPGLIAMVGPPYDLTTVGGDVAWQIGGFGAAFVALMSMFFVGRHTRAGGADRPQRARPRRAGRALRADGRRARSW